MTTITDELLTRKDLMALFKVSQPTVLRLEAAGKLLPMRIGRSVRYRKSDIQRLIANPGQ